MSFTTTLLTLLNIFLATLTFGAKAIFVITTFAFTVHHFVAVVLHANTIIYEQLLDQSEVEYLDPIRPRDEDDLCHFLDQMAIVSDEELWEERRLRVAFEDERRTREEFWNSVERGAAEIFRERDLRRDAFVRGRFQLVKKGWKVWGLGLCEKKVVYCPNGEFGMADW